MGSTWVDAPAARFPWVTPRKKASYEIESHFAVLQEPDYQRYLPEIKAQHRKGPRLALTLGEQPELDELFRLIGRCAAPCRRSPTIRSWSHWPARADL